MDLATGLEPVIPPRQLCVLRCGVPARAATTGYGIVAAQPSSIGEAASSAAYSPCSHTELSQYNYHILMLQDWTVCRLKYRGASDVKVQIKLLLICLDLYFVPHNCTILDPRLMRSVAQLRVLLQSSCSTSAWMCRVPNMNTASVAGWSSLSHDLGLH